MEEQKFDFSKNIGKVRIKEFAEYLIHLQTKIDFKISARGWGYYLESERIINKNQFDKVENAINRCRKRGLIPVDFIAEDSPRLFSGVETPTKYDIKYTVRNMLEDVLEGAKYYTPDWWVGEDYYIQVVVEKIDLKTLFEPVCRKYHIPIATSKGWSSIIQRATYARRYKKAEDMGLQPVLLYCGDHDPDGLRISDFLRSNLYDLTKIYWEDGERGYDPSNLEIVRFGLNKDLIDKHKLTWIDNLITGSGKNLASPNHNNFKLPYVQDYLKTIGVRKCEGNAIIPYPIVAKNLMTNAIEDYLGKGALARFRKKRQDVKSRYEKALDECGVSLDSIKKAIDKIEDER